MVAVFWNVPGRHVTDHQMRLFMKYRQTHSVEVASAKASISRATAFRMEKERGLTAMEDFGGLRFNRDSRGRPATSGEIAGRSIASRSGGLPRETADEDAIFLITAPSADLPCSVACTSAAKPTTLSQIDNPEPVCDSGRSATAGDGKLGQNVGHMNARRFRRNEQSLGYLPIALSGCD